MSTREWDAEAWWRDMIESGQCPYSGLTIRECQSWLCDCFDVPRVES